MNGQRPFEYEDELCEEGDGDGVDLRHKCSRSGQSGDVADTMAYPSGFGPPPEAQAKQDMQLDTDDDDDDEQSITASKAARLAGVSAHIQRASLTSSVPLRGQPSKASSIDDTVGNGHHEKSPKIVTRTFHGQ